MSDLMFYGVLRMPYEMAMADEICRIQFYGRAQQAADRVQAAEREIAELRAALASQSVAVPAEVDDLAALVRQLVHALKKASPTSPLAARSVDYLQRKGLQGSPLRAAAPQPPAVKEVEPAPAEIENAATVGQWRAATDQAVPCGICDDTRLAFGKRCECAGAAAGGPP
jgi:hypothetical protein